MTQTKWIGLGYSIPAHPSKGRVYVWRRLKALGAQVVRPGLAALPNTVANAKAFTELSKKIEEFLGEAQIIEFSFLTDEQNDKLAEKFADSGKQQYRQMLDTCADIIEQLDCVDNDRERNLLEQKLVKTIGKYRQNPIIPMGQQAAGEIEKAFNEMFETFKSMPAEVRALINQNR